MTCRDEILQALPLLRMRLGTDTFTPDDVVEELSRRGSRHKPSTIRKHVTARMSAGVEADHVTTYPDLDLVRPGVYRQAST